MSLSRIIIAAAAALTLVACQGGGSVDSSFPTVAEQDRLDVQWGLSPRTSRGAPKRTYQYSAPTTSYNAPAASAGPAAVPPRESVNALPPAAPAPQLDPAAVNNLR